MNSEPTSFAELAQRFSQSLNEDQSEAFRHLLTVLKNETQSQLTILSRSTSGVYRLLNELTMASN